MTEDGSGITERRSPRNQSTAKVEDFTLLVRVPGRPAAVRVFTDEGRAEADAYAASTGGVVVPLPLPAPSTWEAPEATTEVVR